MLTDWKSRCFPKMGGVPVGNGSTYYPLVLGVGPAKSGSSAFFGMLGRHPEVGLADANAANQPCCGPESYFFLHRWPNTNYYSEYGKYFSNVDLKVKDIRYLAEKTPLYHDDPFVPARINKLLHPSNTILLFTLRNPLDAHVSLFFHRSKGKNPVLLDFFKWSQDSLLSFDTWMSCLSSGWQSLGQDSNGRTFKELDISRLSVTSRCRTHFHEGVSQYKYSYTLQTWQKMLPDFTKICVLHSQLIDDCNHVMEVVQNKLNMSNADLCSKTNGMPKPGKQRLLELNATSSQRMELEHYLSYLSDYFEEDKKMMQSFCESFGID